MTGRSPTKRAARTSPVRRLVNTVGRQGVGGRAAGCRGCARRPRRRRSARRSRGRGGPAAGRRSPGSRRAGRRCRRGAGSRKHPSGCSGPPSRWSRPPLAGVGVHGGELVGAVGVLGRGTRPVGRRGRAGRPRSGRSARRAGCVSPVATSIRKTSTNSGRGFIADDDTCRARWSRARRRTPVSPGPSRREVDGGCVGVVEVDAVEVPVLVAVGVLQVEQPARVVGPVVGA